VSARPNPIPPRVTWGRRLRRIVQFTVVGYAAAASAIAYSGLQDHVEPADAIVVFGNAVLADGQPSARLQARIDAAADLWNQHVARVVVVSGSLGSNGWDASAVMARALEDAGVPAAAIVRDPRGTDTGATAANVAAIARERKFTRVLVVSQYFHLPRARIALSRAGLRVVGTVHARIAELRDLWSLAREVIALPAYAAGWAGQRPHPAPSGSESA
jgi:vancomycin permeability regulator SanA